MDIFMAVLWNSCSIENRIFIHILMAIFGNGPRFDLVIIFFMAVFRKQQNHSNRFIDSLISICDPHQHDDDSLPLSSAIFAFNGQSPTIIHHQQRLLSIFSFLDSEYRVMVFLLVAVTTTSTAPCTDKTTNTPAKPSSIPVVSSKPQWSTTPDLASPKNNNAPTSSNWVSTSSSSTSVVASWSSRSTSSSWTSPAPAAPSSWASKQIPTGSTDLYSTLATDRSPTILIPLTPILSYKTPPTTNPLPPTSKTTISSSTTHAPLTPLSSSSSWSASTLDTKNAISIGTLTAWGFSTSSSPNNNGMDATTTFTDTATAISTGTRYPASSSSSSKIITSVGSKASMMWSSSGVVDAVAGASSTSSSQTANWNNDDNDDNEDDDTIIIDTKPTAPPWSGTGTSSSSSSSLSSSSSSSSSSPIPTNTTNSAWDDTTTNAEDEDNEDNEDEDEDEDEDTDLATSTSIPLTIPSSTLSLSPSTNWQLVNATISHVAGGQATGWASASGTGTGMGNGETVAFRGGSGRVRGVMGGGGWSIILGMGVVVLVVGGM
ncbi:MAG: hypothetical protein Q9186_004968 [Xanthomendoza sp. 1 TL-2023]